MQPILSGLVTILLLAGAADLGLTWLARIGSPRHDDDPERY